MFRLRNYFYSFFLTAITLSIIFENYESISKETPDVKLLFFIGIFAIYSLIFYISEYYDIEYEAKRNIKIQELMKKIKNKDTEE